MNLTRLLVIDDDVKLCRLLGDYLNPLGYAVVASHSGPEGLERALHEEFAAVILDVMLPGMNGLDVLRELRRQSNVPVLMLTALGEEPDRIVGLEMGADDYLPKNFSTRELLARLRAVLRRLVVTAQRPEPARSAPIVVGDLWLDTETRTGALGEKPLMLTPVEFDLLLSLARAAGRVRTREQLLWKWPIVISNRSIAPSTCTSLPCAANGVMKRAHRVLSRRFAARVTGCDGPVPPRTSKGDQRFFKVTASELPVTRVSSSGFALTARPYSPA